MEAIDDRREGLSSTAPVEEEKVTEADDFEADFNAERAVNATQRTGIIIIGSYKFKHSVQKMSDKLVEEGFVPYKEKRGNIIRVGAQFEYEDAADLARIHKIIKRKIERRAWIKKR